MVKVTCVLTLWEQELNAEFAAEPSSEASEKSSVYPGQTIRNPLSSDLQETKAPSISPQNTCLKCQMLGQLVSDPSVNSRSGATANNFSASPNLMTPIMTAGSAETAAMHSMTNSLVPPSAFVVAFSI